MRCLLTSDLHYGFDNKTPQILKKWAAKLPTDFDIMLVAGDMAITHPDQTAECFNILRTQFPEKPICAVLGNHDYWSSSIPTKKIPINRVMEMQEKNFQEYNIHHVENKPFLWKEYIILGFMGWYKGDPPPSNDIYWMPSQVEDAPTHMFMRHKANKALETILDYPIDNKISICLTHFDYTKHEMSAPESWKGLLLKKVDMLCTGHSHIRRESGILNAGSDYNKPRHIIFEV